MTQLADELEQFEGSDALGNGDFSVCLRAAAALRAKPAGEVDGAAAFAHSFVLLNSGNVELAEGVRDYILARTRPGASSAPDSALLPTHYCVYCAARWVRHDDGTWSTQSPCGPCCDNVAMDKAPIIEMKADGTVDGREADRIKREYMKSLFGYPRQPAPRADDALRAAVMDAFPHGDRLSHGPNVSITADKYKGIVAALADQPASDYRCEHCGRLKSSAESNGSTSCAPPCIVQPHAFTGNHPADVAASDASERGR